MRKQLIVLSLLIFSLTACGGNKNEVTKTFDPNATTTATTEHSIKQTDITLETSSTASTNDIAETGTLDYILFPDIMRWNMALAEVKDTETRKLDSVHSLESKNPAFLNYVPNKTADKYFDSVSIVYCFPDNKLQARWCSFDSKKISDYREIYNEVKNAVSSKYGEYESENIVWTDTTYQQDDSKWNDAFRYGYVTIETTWHTSDSAIIITWDYNRRMTVAISTLDFESQL